MNWQLCLEMWQAVGACAGLRPHLGIRECRPKRYNLCIIWTIGYRRDYRHYCHYYHCYFFPLYRTHAFGHISRAMTPNRTSMHGNIAQYHSAQLAAPLETLLAIIQPHAKSQKPTQASETLLTQHLLTYLARTALRLGHLPVTPFRSEANPEIETGNTARCKSPRASLITCKFPQENATHAPSPDHL